MYPFCCLQKRHTVKSRLSEHVGTEGVWISEIIKYIQRITDVKLFFNGPLFLFFPAGSSHADRSIYNA